MNIKNRMKQHLRKVKPYVPGKPVEELRREKNIKGEILKLASNENPYPALDEIKEAIIRELDQIGRYPNSGSHYLCHELAEYYRLDPGQIFVGNGSNEILDLLVRAFIGPGEDIVYPFPSFIAYPLICQQAGVNDIKVPLDDYRIDLEAVSKAITRDTKMVFICNPNNPTATYVTGEELDLFLASIPREIIIVLDEAYYEYVTADDYPDSQKLLESYDNIIILRTFSKVHSLSGLRIGYSISHPDLATCLHMVRQPFNVNRIAQIAARTALKHIDKLSGRIKENASEREFVRNELIGMGFTVPESQTNFLLAVPELECSGIVEKMMDLGVIIRGMAPFGLGDESFRVTVGKPEENRRFLDTLKKVL
ncbi:MAG: histidinol-phosphate transaminase [Candidatus Krumholzibacteriota bacterium]|nr:histidinol-phosphate transaminase [Candidatus Krumholzibacteriota bacterium]